MLREVLNDAQAKSHSPQINRLIHEAALAYSQEHIFERLSVAREHEVLTEALRHGRGNVELSDLQGSLSLERSKGTLIAAGDEIATHASLQRERDVIAVVNRGVDRYDCLGNACDCEPSDRLRPEQKRAVEASPRKANATAFRSGVHGLGGRILTADLWVMRSDSPFDVVGLYLHPRGVLAIQLRGLGSVLPYRSRDVGSTDFDE